MTESDMEPRLARIDNWAQLAHQAEYKVRILAPLCGVSARSLQSFFHEHFHIPPKKWLMLVRQRNAAIMLTMDHKAIKEVALDLNYKHPCHFTRDFARFHHIPPSKLARKSPAGTVPLLS